MKRKIIVSVIVLGLYLCANSLYAATLTRLGTSPLYKAKDLKPQDVYKIVKANAGIAKDGFIKASSINCFDPFMAQLEVAKLEKIQIQPNETFLWMIFKKKNKAHLLRDVVWKGKKPFAAYRFFVNHENQVYEFIFPKACMNITLKSIAPVPKKPVVKKEAPPVVKKEAPPVVKKEAPPAAVAVVKKNEPPYCDLKAAPRRLFTGNIVTLDASGSYDPDGKIESVKFTLNNRSDSTVDEIVLIKTPFIYKANMKNAGDYTIRATVKDDRGDEVTSENCVVDVKVLKRGSFIADLGALKQLDPATWCSLKVGYMYKIKENLAVTGLVGVAPLHSSGSDDRPATVGDVIFSYYLSNFFIGGGAGVFHTSIETKTDLIVDMGYQITHNDTKPNISIYIQGRSEVDELDDYSKRGRLGAGLRIHF